MFVGKPVNEIDTFMRYLICLAKIFKDVYLIKLLNFFQPYCIVSEILLLGRLRAENTITTSCNVFQKSEAWCNKKKATFKDSFKKTTYV